VEVHALEPAPELHAVLARNTAALPNVHTHCVAARDVGDAASVLHYYPRMPGESTFHPDESAAQQQRLGRPPHRGVSVRCATVALGAFLRAHGITRVGLLKVDVEGDELRVLQGLDVDGGWARVDQVVAEVHDTDGRLRAVVALLHIHGFRVNVRPVRSELVAGYQTVVPAALRLFLVYARRPRRRGPVG
jgi:FkbM family methyltransferase